MECTERKSEITDIEDPQTPSLFQFEISETGKPIPFKLIQVKEGGKQFFVISMKTHLNTEISPQNVNVDHDSIQPTTDACNPKEEISNGPVETITINSSDDDDDAADFGDEYDTSNLDNSGNGSHSDDEQPNMTTLKEACSLKPGIPVIRFELKTPQNILVSPPQTPYEAFRWFFSDELLDKIVLETNNFVASLRNATNDLKKVQFSSWTHLTRKELLTFLGLLLHTGTFRMDNLLDYFKADYLVNLTTFAKFMSRDRFLDIFKSLSFAPEETVSSSEDFLANFRPIIDNFNETMKEIYYPGKQLTLANLRTSCRCDKIMSKKSTIDLVSLMLADSNGIVLRYQVDTGSDMVNRDQKILDLIQGLDQGHVIYMDKCFSSYKLAAELLHRQTYCTVEVDKPIKGKLLHENSHSIHGVKNMSTKRKYYMTTEFGSEIMLSSHYKDEFGTVANYTKYMTSKKLVKTLSSYQPCYRNTLHFHQKLLVQALQISMNNAFHLFNLYSKHNHFGLFDFRIFVLKCLLPETDMLPVVISPRSVAIERQLHALTKTTETSRRKRKDKRGEREVYELVRRPCEDCRRKKRRIRSVYQCTGCPGRAVLCHNCFCERHAYYD